MSSSSHGDEARRLVSFLANMHGYATSTNRHSVAMSFTPAQVAVLLAALRADPVRAVEEMRERASAACETEAGACIGDIVEGDELGAKLAHAMAGALFTVAKDIRALPTQPAAEGGADG